MELNRRRRAGAACPDGTKRKVDADKLEEERAKLEEEREAIRQERERLQIEKEREALRKEREALARERQQASQNVGSSASGTAGNSAQALTPGMLIRIQGLRGAPELNGLEATILRFDEASGRFIVNVSEGKGQKSLKDANLVPLVAQPAGLWKKVTDMASSTLRHVQRGCAEAQVCIANSGYSWWQILLGVAVVVLVVSAVMQASSRHNSRKAPSSSSGGSRTSTYRPEYGEDPSFHRRAPRYEEDDFGYSDYDDSGSGGIDFGGMQKYLIIGGLAILCWKGIIPIHRMDWFQLYMLWNFLQSTGILGGRGGHYGGFGRRRRGFF
ncbi:unnamed protein product [Symbiodinium pilosum]|uniref:Uncharacterized protein n=1 Tax=Symbiodinium pilosum TaxID=2952 RepID=A0A812W8F7_SYMPI|nr:unnamed protein product [Symbiodinium pilosum]